jgi:hypothetical protein
MLPVVIPPENTQTYVWRGDLGLLDRLSYGNSREIPRNWRMTSLDAARIQSRLQSTPMALQWEETDLISDQPSEDINDGAEIMDVTGEEMAKEQMVPQEAIDKSAMPKKKR